MLPIKKEAAAAATGKGKGKGTATRGNSFVTNNHYSYYNNHTTTTTTTPLRQQQQRRTKISTRNQKSLYVILRHFLISTPFWLSICFFFVGTNLWLYKLWLNETINGGGGNNNKNGGTIRRTMEPPESEWLQEQAAFVTTNNDRTNINDTTSLLDWRKHFVIGIPTIAREGHPDYLLRTIESWLTIGQLQQSQITILHGRPKEDHVILRQVLNNNNHSHSYHFNDIPLLSQDTNHSAFSIEYHIPKNDEALSSPRFMKAWNDHPSRKQWRIQEAHDVLWLCRHLLQQYPTAQYIGFVQDDARLLDPLPNNIPQRLDGSNRYRHVLSLYSNRSPHNGRRFCFTNAGLFCGMVSMIFRRQTLQLFVYYLMDNDRYKFLPIDWTFDEFLKQHGYITSVYATIQHLGIVSSNGKTHYQKFHQADTIDRKSEWFQYHNVYHVDRIVHKCPYDPSPFTNTTTQPTSTSIMPPQLLSMGLLYTNQPSNQRMQHVLYQYRNMNCLSLQQLYIAIPSKQQMTRMIQSQWIPVVNDDRFSSTILDGTYIPSQQWKTTNTNKMMKKKTEGRQKGPFQREDTYQRQKFFQRSFNHTSDSENGAFQQNLPPPAKNVPKNKNKLPPNAKIVWESINNNFNTTMTMTMTMTTNDTKSKSPYRYPITPRGRQRLVFNDHDNDGHESNKRHRHHRHRHHHRRQKEQKGEEERRRLSVSSTTMNNDKHKHNNTDTSMENIQMIMDELNRPYQGYESIPLQVIPPPLSMNNRHQGHDDDDNNNNGVQCHYLVTVQEFLHVARYLLRTTSSEVIGIHYDSILPAYELPWKELLTTMIGNHNSSSTMTTNKNNTNNNQKNGIVSLFHTTMANGPMTPNYNNNKKKSPPPPSTKQSSSLICGWNVHCPFQSMLFTRHALHNFCHWMETTTASSSSSSTSTSSCALEDQLLQFAKTYHYTIRALPGRISKYIGTRTTTTTTMTTSTTTTTSSMAKSNTSNTNRTAMT